MKILLGIFLVAVGVSFVAAACQLGLGRRESGETLLHTLRISREPVLQPMNMSLVFDYIVSPADVYLQIMRVQIDTTSVGVDDPRCQASWPLTPALPQGFHVTITSLQPVLQMSGTAEVYGIRRINA
ncbi:uncharacterized protein LOC119766912 [Culex quinquefasciatus]|uniref:uncharacterized protein LOC119766912 n=1 Tax=Culex quinquefasciatus TaxID=7176 RepID=UPI0018E29D2C|nr:uncharacterized protein LOC119766912 [Culex quinquefasciatus]